MGAGHVDLSAMLHYSQRLIVERFAEASLGATIGVSSAWVLQHIPTGNRSFSTAGALAHCLPSSHLSNMTLSGPWGQEQSPGSILNVTMVSIFVGEKQ